ncbi:hypothetical protein [Helicobacter pylori]|uniref:hypothetical protein n=1 Tax=Helicobacter pylori TaxID=210 RepID=UPI002AC4F2B2|nr:hypothetical protein [Helicobacter pylori]MDZ5288566.1 hypothetical protein [Helicobacter pylori]
MTFVLKHKDIVNPNKTASKEFTHDSGLTVSFKSFLTPSFQRAYSLITAKMNAETSQSLTIESISKQAFNDDTLSFDQALVVAIGEHLIADWNVVDENGDKLPVTGKNLLLLLNQVDSASEIVQWCMDCTSDLAKSLADDLLYTKKKSSNVGNGKKSTQA